MSGRTHQRGVGRILCERRATTPRDAPRSRGPQDSSGPRADWNPRRSVDPPPRLAHTTSPSRLGASHGAGTYFHGKLAMLPSSIAATDATAKTRVINRFMSHLPSDNCPDPLIGEMPDRTQLVNSQSMH